MFQPFFTASVIFEIFQTAIVLGYAAVYNVYIVIFHLKGMVLPA